MYTIDLTATELKEVFVTLLARVHQCENRWGTDPPPTLLAAIEKVNAVLQTLDDDA